MHEIHTIAVPGIHVPFPGPNMLLAGNGFHAENKERSQQDQ
jgi:hypothetical protein